MSRTPEQRYYNDPMFARVVDTLYGLVVDCQLTPSEIREAAMLACIKYEMHRPSRAFGLFDPAAPAPEQGKGTENG